MKNYNCVVSFEYLVNSKRTVVQDLGSFFLKRPTVPKDGPQLGPRSCPPLMYVTDPSMSKNRYWGYLRTKKLSYDIAINRYSIHFSIRSLCCNIIITSQKSISIHQYYRILFNISRQICNETEFRLVTNHQENVQYNLILV